MSVSFIVEEASGSFAATSGRILEVTTLGDAPTVLSVFLYASLTFAASGSLSVATLEVTGAVSGNYYAYQWGNAGGWSLPSPWILGAGVSADTCLVYGTSYNIDGTPASGSTVTATYNQSKGSLVASSILGTKTRDATVASDGSWSMTLLKSAKVKFTHSANTKLNAEGVVPDATTASVQSFAVNI